MRREFRSPRSTENAEFCGEEGFTTMLPETIVLANTWARAEPECRSASALPYVVPRFFVHASYVACRCRCSFAHALHRAVDKGDVEVPFGDGDAVPNNGRRECVLGKLLAVGGRESKKTSA